MGGSDSNVVVTDLLLDTFTVFNVASTPGQNIYVTWVEPVPGQLWQAFLAWASLPSHSIAEPGDLAT